MTGARVFRNLARHPIRTGLAVLGIAIAAALLLDMVMLAGGMERSFTRMLLSRGYQIRLSPQGTLPFDSEAVIPGATPLVVSLRADPDIESVGPVVAAAVHVGVEGSTLSVVAYGIDPEGQGLYELERGADLAPGDTTGLLISEPAARAAGWAIGDTVTVFGQLDPQSAEPGTQRQLTVRGVVRFLYDARDQRSVGAAFRVVQGLGTLAERDPASVVMVKVRDDALVEAVAARIATSHPNVEVNSIAMLVSQFRGRLAYFQQLSLILATISLVVAVLLVGTILSITVGERMGEFAVLRGIGVRQSRIVRMVIVEGAALTGIGVAFGLALGLVTARHLDSILTSFPGLPAAISFFVADRASLIRAGATVLAAGTLAAAYPAWLAARAPIALTLRSEAE